MYHTVFICRSVGVIIHCSQSSLYVYLCEYTVLSHNTSISGTHVEGLQLISIYGGCLEKKSQHPRLSNFNKTFKICVSDFVCTYSSSNKL